MCITPPSPVFYSIAATRHSGLSSRRSHCHRDLSLVWWIRVNGCAGSPDGPCWALFRVGLDLRSSSVSWSAGVLSREARDPLGSGYPDWNMRIRGNTR